MKTVKKATISKKKAPVLPSPKKRSPPAPQVSKGSASTSTRRKLGADNAKSTLLVPEAFNCYVHNELVEKIRKCRPRLKKIGLISLSTFETTPKNLESTAKTAAGKRRNKPLDVIIVDLKAFMPPKQRPRTKKRAAAAPAEESFPTWLNAVELLAHPMQRLIIIAYRKQQEEHVAKLPFKENYVLLDQAIFTTPGILVRTLVRELQHARYRQVVAEASIQKHSARKQNALSASQASYHKEQELISKEILNIGLNISKERDTVKILEEILVNSMRITHADAGSIAIRGMDKELKKTNQDVLTFYISKNTSREIHFSRFSMPVSKKSLGGYTTITGELINVKDAYLISSRKVYSFNREFDQKTRFRTKSVIVVPMTNQKGETIGIIQLINKKAYFDKIIDYAKFKEADVLSFNDHDVTKLQALASLATISLQNAILYSEIDNLFHSFVEASVSAVEQRDPATSGHSFRVSKFSTLLAQTCNDAGGFFSNWHFTSTQLRELEYASLLHDFGKIGVREHVLLKSHKMERSRFWNLLRKFDIIILDFEKQSYREILAAFREGAQNNTPLLELEQKAAFIKAKWIKKIEQIKHYKKIIEQCNEGARMTPELKKIIETCSFMDVEAVFFKEKLITHEEEGFLTIPYGTLSERERIEIQSHVTHTFEFLKKIPWTEELKHIPEIAHYHHEKLDGTGYPIGIKSVAIPAQTKIMTICDIYDALTSADRPYKKSMDQDKAIFILKSESADGKLHPDLLELFIRTKAIRDSIKPQTVKELNVIL